MLHNLQLNNDLYVLKQILESVEPYNPHDNIGHRSLKNLGVWLIAYALTEKSQQYDVVKDLLIKANKPDEVAFAKKIIDKLSNAENLTAIIYDYEHANGMFDIFISDPARLKGFKEKANQVGLGRLIEKHLKVDTSKGADLIFDMNNTVKFAWQDSDPRSHCPAKLVRDKNVFNNEKMNYLTANSNDHAVSYDLVKIIDDMDDLFHVIRLSALQDDGKGPAKQTAVYLIEPVDPKTDLILLQKHYYSIVTSFKSYHYKEIHDSIKKIAKQPNQKNLTIKEVINPEGFDDFTDYHVIVHFPELAGPLKTEEHRLGIYSSFLGKTIGSFYAGDLEYLGQRELEYDVNGGTIKNREELCVLESYMMRNIPSKEVTIDYTVKGPYALVYEANNGADYYPFIINDPRKNLEKTFGSSESYGQVKAEAKSVVSHAKQPLFSKHPYDLRSKHGLDKIKEVFSKKLW